MSENSFLRLAENEALIAYYPHRKSGRYLLLREWDDIRFLVVETSNRMAA